MMVKEKMRLPVEILWTDSRNALYHQVSPPSSNAPRDTGSDFPIYRINLSNSQQITCQMGYLSVFMRAQSRIRSGIRVASAL
jgi:hypothetical protein